MMPATDRPTSDGPPQAAAPRRGFPPAGVAVLVLVQAALALSVVARIPVHHDIAWPLWVAERVLDGAALYVDVVEVHPPLIVGVAMVAVLLGGLPLLDAIGAYHLLGFAAVATSLALCWRVLRVVAVDAACSVLLLVAAFVLLPLVGYSFGQEEHLMLALTLPYLLLLGVIAGGGALSRRVRVALGVLGGIGICMKPFFGPLWLALALYLAWRRGARRLLAAEVLAPALVICTYIAFTVLVTPGYFAVARMAAQVYYDFFPVPLSWLVVSGGTAALLGALLLERVLPSAAGLREVRRVLAVALAAFYMAVLAQQKGWSYHWYPVYGGALLLATAALVDQRGDVLAPGSGARRALRLAAVVLLLGAASWRASWSRNFWGDLSGDPFHLPHMRQVVERFGGTGPIAALSIGMPVAFPLVTYAGVGWAPRFACLWMLPGIYRDVVPRAGPFPYERTGAAARLDRYVVAAVTADLVRARPTLLIVDAAPPMPRLQGFDYLAYFGRDPAFRALLAGYAPLGTVGRYQLFRRMDR